MGSACLNPNSRILVICVARIGDTLLVTPALRALRAAVPQGDLTVLAHSKRRALLQHLSFIDKLGSIGKRSAPWRGWIFLRRYDWGVVYGEDASLIRYALRTSHRVVAHRQKDPSLTARLAVVVENALENMVAVDERLRLVAALGAPVVGRSLDYNVVPEERAAAEARLSAFSPGISRYVGIQLQSFPTKTYRDWPLDAFWRLSKRLLQQKDIGVVVLGGPESARIGANFARALAAEFPGRVMSLAGHTRLRDGAAVIASLDLYVGVDTGPTHLAGALRIPMVAIYHCCHRGRWLAPLEHPALSVIEHPAVDDDCGQDRTMHEIGFEEVATAAEKQLLKGRRSRC